MSRLLVAQRALTVPAWVKDSLWRRARAAPSLDLRFADSKSLADAVTGASLVTHTRVGSGTFTDSAGTLQTAATDVPRFDHNPATGESLGLLVEEARTNSIRNNTMVGAVAGTPGTLPTNWSFSGAGSAIEVVGTGIENGINYIDVRFSGTITNTNLNFETTTSASASQAWAASSYLRLISGTFTGNWRLTCNEFASGGGFLRTGLAQTFTPTNTSLSTQRVAGSFTTGVSTAVISVLINGQGAATPIDFTLRIGLPQLEQGAFATSPILTSTAAATRAADVVSITGSAFSSWYRQDEGTIYHQGSTASAGNFFSIDDSTVSNRITSYFPAATAPALFIATGGATQANISSSAITAGSMFAQANAYKANDFVIVTNGGAASTDTSGSVPTVNRMVIGVNNFGTANINGTIKRLVFWPQRLPSSTLQSITQ